MKNTIIALLVVLVLGLGGYILWSNSRTAHDSVSQTTQLNDTSTTSPGGTSVAVSHETSKQSTAIAGPADPNVITYTSYKLGVQFSYLKDGGKYWGTGVVTHVESGNKISLEYVTNGKTQPYNANFVQVFQKLSGESVDQTLRRLVPQAFTSNNCVVLSGKASNQYFIWDQREPLAQRGADSTDFTLPNGTWATNTCGAGMPLYFLTDPNSPDKVYYIGYDTQAPTYGAASNQTTDWVQTVHLIP